MDTYPIPQADKEAFHRDLPMDMQLEIVEILQAFWTVDHAPHGATMQTWAAEVARINAYFATKMIGRRVTVKGLGNSMAQFRKSGKDWTVLIDRRRVTDWDQGERRSMPHGDPVHPDFVDFVRGLACRQARSSEQAIDELHRRWRAGEHVPGYGVWTSWFADTYPGEPYPDQAPLPRSWSRSSLRRLMPPPAELAGARRGVSAALAKLPDIIRTREGLRPMEFVVMDDWRADFMCFVPGVDDAVEINGILAMDVACALPLRYGLRPALPREDGSSEGLKRIDTKSLVVDMLIRHGYPLDYPCTLIVENGTATITPDDAKAIEIVTDGQVKVRWTSMISGRVFGFADRPVGNFKGKAWLESFFSLLHNAAGNIQGQIGASYDVRPRSIPARIAELRSLVRAEKALPAHMRESINYRHPFVSLKDAKSALDFVFNFLGQRTHHNCEGFDQILKVRLSPKDPWRSVSDLVAAGNNREALLALGPRPMIESPKERWTKLTRDVRFGKLPFSSMPMLLANHKEVVVEEAGEINLGSARHPAVYRDRRSAWLVPGRKYLAWFSTTDGEWCHLTQDKRYVCSVPRATASSLVDSDAASREIAAKQGQLKQVLRRIRSYDLGADERRQTLEANLTAAQTQLAAQEYALAPAINADAIPEGHVVTDMRAAAAARQPKQSIVIVEDDDEDTNPVAALAAAGREREAAQTW
jgi:hypothetical protein